MSVHLLDRPITPVAIVPSPQRQEGVLDEGYEALPHLTRLRDRLAAALAAQQSSHWKEPLIFFFDQRRQGEFAESRQTIPTDPFADISAAIEAELPMLIASIDVRRVARAIDGLRRTAEALAMKCSPAKELADLLAVPDDEVVVVLFPDHREGFRFAIRGVADVGQFHILLTNTLAGDPASIHLVNRPFAKRFVTTSREANASTPGRRSDGGRGSPPALRTNGALARWIAPFRNGRLRALALAHDAARFGAARQRRASRSRRAARVSCDLGGITTIPFSASRTPPDRNAQSIPCRGAPDAPGGTANRPRASAPSGSGIIESGLKSDGRWGADECAGRARHAIERARQPRSRAGHRKTIGGADRRTVPAASAPRESTRGNSRSALNASASSSARSSTDSSLKAGITGVEGASPTTRRMAAAMSPLATSSRTGLVRGGNNTKRAPRSKSAAAQAARSASGSLTSATATTGVSGARRRTAAISSRDAHFSSSGSNCTKTRLVAAPRVTARRQPIVLTGRANGSRRPARAVASRSSHRLRE